METSNQVAVLPAQAAPSLIEVISQAALNPAIDIEKMKALLAMKKEIDADVAERAFADDFSRMKPHLPVIAKTHNNTQTKSKYAKLEDISKVVDPIISEYGFSTRFRTTQDEKSVTVICVLQHRDGHREETSIVLPLDDRGAQGTVNKTQVHAIASSIMYAKRLAKCAALDISTGDDDGNGAGNGHGQKVTEFQADGIKEVLMACSDKTRDWFMSTYGSIADVPRADYTALLSKLKKAKEAAGANS